MNSSFLLAAIDTSLLGPDLRLSTLHFLEFAIWGAWWVVLGQYLDTLKFSRQRIGSIYATMSLGAIIAPMFVGTIADRYFASEHVMAVSQLIGAALLFWLAHIRTERKFYWVTLAYALVFSPTLSLVVSIAFSHVPNPDTDFPIVRAMGTVGWIVANLALKALLKPGQPVSNRPILLASALSLVLGVFSFWLPHTPPSAAAVAPAPSVEAETAPVTADGAAAVSPEQAIPFMKAIALLQQRSFAVFFGVTFLLTIALAFYFSFTAIFLERHIHVRPDNVAPLMTLGQWLELGVMLVLGWFMQKFGIQWVLVMGMAAWALRYAIFGLTRSFPLIVLAVALHGICFSFIFAAGNIYVDNEAPKAIRASAQALFAVLTYGVGMYIGTEASGWLNQRLTREVVDPATGKTERVTDWRTFWLVPGAGCLASLVLFLLLFR